MKKHLKHLIAFTFAAALLLTTLAPTASILAASQSNPVLVTDLGNLKEYKFQPSFYELAPGETITLSNLINQGSWYIPAGNKFSFACNFFGESTIKYKVYRTSQPQEIIYEEVTMGSVMFDIIAQKQSHQYYVTITNVGTQTVLVDNYFGYYQ